MHAAAALTRLVARGTLACLLAAAVLCGCAAPDGPGGEGVVSAPLVPERLIIIAVPDRPQAMQSAGSSARPDYRYRGAYVGSDRAQALVADVARDHALREVTAWAIDPLRVHCVVYEIAPGADRAVVLAALAQDKRVSLVQPFNSFETYAPTDRYNDPYASLQGGLVELDVASAQTQSRGEGVTVAVIDTSVDAGHPDLARRVAMTRDFAAGHPPRGGESHGTQVAGVIAATANNGIGMVGVAPGVRLFAYRACWALPAEAVGSRCNSLSLAQALTAAIAADVDIINLSLGGPRDALLEGLVEYALSRGTIVVGAVPPSGALDGFPGAMPGVIAVDAPRAGTPNPKVLVAPGRKVLTLAPGGHYDFASGSSLATAHVTGAIALLKSMERKITSGAVRESLARSQRAGGVINVCLAMRHRGSAGACSVDASPPPPLPPARDPVLTLTISGAAGLP